MTGKFERIRVKVPFGYKLMISYCVFIIIPVLLVGNIATQIFVTSIREQTHNNIQGTLHQMNNNITYKIEDIVRISDMLYFDTLFNNRLRYTESQWVSYDTMVKVLIPKLETAISTANRKIWMSIYLKNNDLGEVYDNYSIPIRLMRINGCSIFIDMTAWLTKPGTSFIRRKKNTERRCNGNRSSMMLPRAASRSFAV